MAETHDGATAKLAAALNARGMDADALLADEATAREALGRFIWGDPDEVAERIRELLAVGLDGIVVNMVLDSEPEAIALAGETLSKALA
jgi:alkanesulfonate monooxygenase SsuD/methylene tetrahydromethanopterin reductase-like flavin-dependent oxidoreductase (luciferase family)